MKIIITALKAPWPEGSKIGDEFTVDNAEQIPGWALGKCRVVADEADADAGTPPAQVDQDELKIAQNMLAEANRAHDELVSRVEQAEAAAIKANTERDAAVQRAEAADAALVAMTA